MILNFYCRFVKAYHSENHQNPSVEDSRFWLAEARTPIILKTIALYCLNFVEDLKSLLPDCTDDEIQAKLAKEEKAERSFDRRYWDPQLKELEAIRLNAIDILHYNHHYQLVTKINLTCSNILKLSFQHFPILLSHWKLLEFPFAE